MNILVSACLLGVECRYHGGGELHEYVEELMKDHTLIPFCPEVYGGLPTPRDPAEIKDKKVVTCEGCDVTAAYRRGAEQALKLARLYQCPLAILKARSPSCGSGQVYDGTFQHKLVEGDGCTAALLLEHGIRVYTEEQKKQIKDALDECEKV